MSLTELAGVALIVIGVLGGIVAWAACAISDAAREQGRAAREIHETDWRGDLL